VLPFAAPASKADAAIMIAIAARAPALKFISTSPEFGQV
jgi:hypothetical protein